MKPLPVLPKGLIITKHDVAMLRTYAVWIIFIVCAELFHDYKMWKQIVKIALWNFPQPKVTSSNCRSCPTTSLWEEGGKKPFSQEILSPYDRRSYVSCTNVKVWIRIVTIAVCVYISWSLQPSDSKLL